MRYLIYLCFLPLSACGQSNTNVEPRIKPDQDQTPDTPMVTDISPSATLHSYLFDPLLNGKFLFPVNRRGARQQITAHALVYPGYHGPVLAIGNGVIRSVASDSAGRQVRIDMPCLENGHPKQHRVTYRFTGSHFILSAGDTVRKGDTLILSEGDLHLQLEDSVYTQSLFYEEHSVPSEIAHLIVIDKKHYYFWFLEKGIVKHQFPIALGQDPKGHKVQQGDNRTPEGEYQIVEKLKGPFHSPTGPWLGNSWFRLNYPNGYDAMEGYQKGLISLAEHNQIIRAYKSGRDTPNNTALGGHIGIHGWSEDWYNYHTHDITWGCVSMRNHQIDEIYDEIPVGTKVLILP